MIKTSIASWLAIYYFRVQNLPPVRGINCLLQNNMGIIVSHMFFYVGFSGHNYIGSEHLLLGLLREGEGVAARVLESLGADPNNIRTQEILFY
jgi:hypothetical protein